MGKLFMKHVLQKILLMPLVFCAQLSFAQEQQMFINRDNMKVFAEKNTKSKVVEVLKQGDKVVVQEGGNALFKKIVTESGKTGFVPYIALTERTDQSMKKIVNFVRGFTRPSAEESDVSRTRSANAVMGIRGLATTNDEALTRVNGSRPNLAAVYQMEDRSISRYNVEKLSEQVLAEVEKNNVK